MCVPVSVCVSLMGRRLLFGGKPQLDCVAVCFCCTWQQVSPVCRCLLHAHRVQPLSLCLCSELALIEGQGQRAFASAAAHVRLRRRRVDAAWRSFKLLLLHCTAGLCVYVLCVRIACEVGILVRPLVTKTGWVTAEDSSHDSSTNWKSSSLSLPTYICIVYIHRHVCMYPSLL